MENTINLISIIIWPFVTLTIFFFLRKPIGEIIKFIKNIKYRDLEVTFENSIESLKDKIDPSEKSELNQEDIENIYRLVDVSHSAAILQSWKELELVAREKVIELIKNENENEYSSHLRNPISYLANSSALNQETFQTAEELRRIRNQYAHTDGIELSRKSVLDYVKITKEISIKIEAISELPKLKHLFLTLLILQLNQLIDSGKYNNISISDIHVQIKEKNIIPYLDKIAAEDSDFGFFLRDDGNYNRYLNHYNEEMESIYNCYGGDEGRKWGVENLGLCLLLAWTNEILQQGTGWLPRD